MLKPAKRAPMVRPVTTPVSVHTAHVTRLQGPAPATLATLAHCANNPVG